jgi:proteasome regulatory subunit
MQFLAEIDGFKHLGDVKVIGCTNRKDIMDPAIIRPGRLDRLIEIPLPDNDGKKEIFKIHTKNMRLDKKIKINDIIKKMDNFSGAEIKAVCTEAGYFAIRKNKSIINELDLLDAITKVKAREEAEGKDYMNLFG